MEFLVTKNSAMITFEKTTDDIIKNMMTSQKNQPE